MSQTARFDPRKTCICGTDLDKYGVDAAHWASPTSAVAIAYSCSELCGDLIERARDENLRLTRAMVTAVRNAVVRQGAKWN
jgi:hypothetical protein